MVLGTGSGRGSAAPTTAHAAEVADATRRTLLASERSELAWWRTGLTALAVALGVGRVVPELNRSAVRWPYVDRRGMASRSGASSSSATAALAAPPSTECSSTGASPTLRAGRSGAGRSAAWRWASSPQC